MSPVDRLAWGLALAADKPPACAYAVALVLMEHANSATGEARPGLRERLGVDTAKRGARWLKGHGWVDVVRAEPGRPVVYRLTAGRMPRGKTAPGAGLHRVQHCPDTRCNPAPGPGAVLPPEPGKNQGSNQGVREDGDQARRGDDTVMTFPTKVGGTWTMTAAFLAALVRDHPDVDVPHQLHQAAAWLIRKPARAKTAAGMRRFLNSWMERSHKTASPPPSVPFPTLPPEDDVGDDVRLTLPAGRVRA